MKLYRYLFCICLLCAALQLHAAFWRSPYLQNMQPTAVTLMWWSSTNAAGQVDGEPGWVEYGINGYDFSSAADQVTTNTFNGLTGIVHRVTLENLAANSNYIYRVICGGATNSGVFRTYPAATDTTTPVTFAVQGDISIYTQGDTKYRALCNWQTILRPNAFLLLGDIVTDGDPLVSDAWNAFFAGGAAVMTNTPTYITPGDTEYHSGSLAFGYDAAFSFPTNGPANPADHTYSFDCGMAHVTVIEMQSDSVATPDPVQFTWVTNDLARTCKPWKIVMTHHPIYTTGKRNVANTIYFASTSRMLTNYYVPEFEKYNVNVFLDGHDRIYEHSLKSNVHYVTLTTARETSFLWENPYSVNFVNTCSVAAMLAITNGVCNVTVKYYANGKVQDANLDSFVITNNAYFTASGVPNPSNQSAVTNSANPFSEIALAWSANAQGRPVMIVRKKSSEPWTEPTPATSYSIDAMIGSGRVVYNGNGGACTNTGLSSGTTYDYKFYSVSNSYYSVGVTAQATTAALIIVDPSNQSAVINSANPFSQIDVAWLKNAQNHNVMVVRKKSTEPWTEPAPGTSYPAGAPIGSGIVVYNGSGTVYANTGLSPTTTYDYKFYSETNSCYSAGVTAQASTMPVNDPSNQTAAPNSANPSNQIDVAWSTNAQGHNVMIVRRNSTEPWTEPTQGTHYTVGEMIGSGIVVYNGNGSAYTNTGLSPDTTYAYKFYSTTNDYYSAGVTAQATTAPDDAASQPRLSFWRTPYLQNMTTSAVTIMWWNNTNTAGGVGYAAGRVEYGKTGYEFSSTADHIITNTFDGQTGIVHRITLENLDANCDYLYRVICGGATNGSSLRTFPAASDYNAQVTFAVQGDASLGRTDWSSYDRYPAFCEWQAPLRPNAFLLLGDIVTDGEALLSDAWHVFFTNGAALLAKSPSYITLGNHDYGIDGLAPGFDEAFSFPTNGLDTEHVYSFDSGIAHITVCEIHSDSNTHDFEPGTPQFTWITNDLARTSKPWKIVLLHHTIYTSGKPTQDTSAELARDYVPEFEKYNVNLSLNGHDHLYEHSLKSNVHYMTLSTIAQQDIQNTNPYSVLCLENCSAAAMLEITGAVCTVTVMGVPQYDSLPIIKIDDFTITNTAYYYFTVKDLNPTNQSAQNMSPNQIDVAWSKDAQAHNVMIVRKHATNAWAEPTQGTPYAVGTNIGNGVVVYNGDGTACENTGLSPKTTYDYKLYSENNGYYSSGVTATATTIPEPGVVVVAGVAMLAVRVSARRRRTACGV